MSEVKKDVQDVRVVNQNVEPARVFPNVLVYLTGPNGVENILFEGAAVGTDLNEAIDNVKFSVIDEIKKARDKGLKVRVFTENSGGLL